MQFDTVGKTYKVVGETAADYYSVLGGIVRDFLPPYANKWSDIPKDVTEAIYPRMREWFSFKDGEHEKAATIRDAKSRFRDWKNELRDYFDSVGGAEDVEAAKKAKYKKVDKQQDWELVCDRFASPEFQVIVIYLKN